MMKRRLEFNKSGMKSGLIFLMAAFFALFAFLPKEALAQSVKASNDPYSDAQWYISNPGYYISYTSGTGKKLSSTEGIDLNVAKAWESMKENGISDREVVVAIIDTGVDYKHKDLAGHIWINEGEIKDDHIDNDNNGYVDDYYGWDFYNDDASVCHYEKGKNTADEEDSDNHGTHIAGIIAATADNGTGIAGVASNINIKLMILKINGGKDKEGKISDAIEAIRYAAMMGADICNLSWGTNEYSEELYQVMKESNMLFVAAAGSENKNNDEIPVYPASFSLDNLISVTSVNADGELPLLANYGANSVDIAAPGEMIYSTVVGGYAMKGGSSMAAPQVTAVAALLYSCSDHAYASNIKDIILKHLKPLSQLEGKVRYPGIPDAYACILAQSEIRRDNAAPKLSPKTKYNKNIITVTMNARDSGGSGIRSIRWIYGKKDVVDFKHGTNGTRVEENQVDLSVAGTYTFYIADYAGNEAAFTYEVTDDKTAPKLSVSYTVAADYEKRTVTIKASDTQSGIKRMKYMAGKKTAKDFLPADAGKKISLKDGKGSFSVKKDGTYTVFAADYRGNMTVKVINVKTVKASGLSFKEKDIKLRPGEEYYLKVTIVPENSTDIVSYTSRNEQIAMVTSNGKVTALSDGTAFITAETANGIKIICKITVFSDA